MAVKDDGYIKLYRALKDWRYKKKPNYVALWVDLLSKANLKDKVVEDVLVKRGSLITSIDNLSRDTGLSIQQVRTILHKLNNEEIIVKSTNKFTLISIVKFEYFQGSDKQINKQITNKQQTNNNKQEIKNKEIEEEDINIIRSFLVEDFTEARVKEAENLLSDYPHTIHDVGRLAEQLTKGIINKKGYVYKMMKGKYEIKNI